MTFWSLLNYAILKRLFVRGESKEALPVESRLGLVQNRSEWSR